MAGAPEKDAPAQESGGQETAAPAGDAQAEPSGAGLPAEGNGTLHPAVPQEEAGDQPSAPEAPQAAESAGETGEGVKPETPGELLESIGQAVDEGAGVRVDVVGAQDMLTQEEYEALKSLPAKEQLLVTLAYVEWGAQAEGALSSLDVPLSEQAASLMEQIAARLDALTPEERAAQQERLSQLFPAGEEEEADGTQRPYRSIDLRIDVDGTTYTQRYDLLLDETP